MYRHHVEKLATKVTSCTALICSLPGITWGAGTQILHLSIKALIFSAAEYHAPVWSKGAHKLDAAIKKTLCALSLEPSVLHQLTSYQFPPASPCQPYNEMQLFRHCHAKPGMTRTIYYMALLVKPLHLLT